jgi:chitodextrinase
VVDGKTSTSITLSWEAIKGVDEYEIEYNGQVLITNELSIEITGLTPNTEYSIRVRGRIDGKHGDWSLSINVKTNLAIGFPKHVVVDVKTSTSITLSWEGSRNQQNLFCTVD